MTDLALLGRELDVVVRAVPGVVALYSARPAIVTSLRNVTAGDDPTSLVQVQSTDEGLSIVASIGVSSEWQAPHTAAVVSAAVLDAVPDGVHARVHVRVSRVEVRSERSVE